jgi:hypothetical protein
MNPVKRILLWFGKFLYTLLAWVLQYFTLPIPILYNYVAELHDELIEMERSG